MVKTPKTRHSKSKRPPVTIDLDPASVSRVPGDAERPGTTRSVTPAAAEPAGEAAETQTAADFEAGEATGVQRDRGDQQAQAETKDASDAAVGAAGEEDSGLNERMEGEERPADAGGHEPPSDTASRPAETRSAGNGAALVAGVFGAVIALLLAGLLQWAGVLPSANMSADDTRLAGLQQQVASLQDNLDSISDGSADAAAAQKVNALQETVSGLQSSLEKMQSGDSGRTKNVQTLESRMSALEKQAGNLAKSVDGGKAAQALEQRVSKMQITLQSATEAAEKARTATSDQLKSLDARVSDLAKKVEANANQPNVLRLVAATSLKSVIDRGEPFASALDTFARVTPDSPDLAPLKPFADKGIPTRAALSGQVDEVATAMVDAARENDPNAGYAERFWDSARSLVDVRPVGNVEGNEAPSVVARFEADVKAGDYQKALAEYGKLPDDAKAAGKDFIGKLRARQAADTIVDKALSDALKAA